MHPCPIGRGLSLLSNLFVIDYTPNLDTSRGRSLGLRGWCHPVCPGRVHLGGVEIIGSGTVQPTVGKAFRGVKKDTLLTLEHQGGVGGVLGD